MEIRQVLHSASRLLCILAAVAALAGAASGPAERVLYSFTGGRDGDYPDSDLVIDSAGNLYGTTVQGGDFDSGAVFELTPSGSGWIETTLYSFTSGKDGGQPYGGVTLDAAGNLYGTAVVGGSTSGVCVENGCGVVFKLTNTGGVWSQSVIHTFTGGRDGYGPGAGLTFDKQGNLYGMTPTGGTYGLGVIYELTPTAGGWTEKIVHTFTGGDDGGAGSAGRLLDAAGNLYGVATVGGAYGSGTAFELTPPHNGAWKFSTLYAFKGQPDAGFPYGALAADPAGNLYGTSYYDGANDLGAVYELTRSGGAWSEAVLYSFKGAPDGSGPISNLVYRGGSLFGTTSEGGASACGCGAIFSLAPGGGGWSESVLYNFKGAPDGGFVYNGMIAGPTGSLYGTTVHGGVDDEGSIFRFIP
ncbi:MAG TPA: choice-of-anchor tandem repeat GloVer-containing protein [Terriglobia bacterium]|nr:choice-of-anchor tandem repeat GloVer-containing protein [Terriglobia bacterium]